MRTSVVVLLVALIFMITANPAHAAGGVAMRWDRCYGAGGESNKNFACNTNAGSEKLVLSYVPAAAYPDWSGVQIVVDGLSGTNSTPPWWQIRNTGTCRQAALTANVIADPSATHCIDNYQANGAGGIGAYTTDVQGWPGRVRLTLAFAVPPENAVTLNAGVEYFACNIMISHIKTVGTGACAGCAEPFCLLLSSIKLTRWSGIGNQKLTEHIGPNSAVVGWQGASPVPFYHPPTTTYYTTIPGYWDLSGCTLPTPTNNPTWGAIKSLYR